IDSIVLFFAMLAFVPLFFFASVYAQVSLSASPNQAALFLLYFFAGFAVASQWGGRILDKSGARPALKLGTVVGAVGFALWAGDRAIGVSCGEVSGITQTVRNYAASGGLAVFGTVLAHVTTEKVVNTLESRGVPPEEARGVARSVTEAVTGNADERVPEGGGRAAESMRETMSAVRMDFAEANQWVFYGMAIALGIAFLFSLRHPGGRVTEETP